MIEAKEHLRQAFDEAMKVVRNEYADGIMEYVGIGNLVDAATLAAAIRFLIRRGFADGPQG